MRNTIIEEWEPEKNSLGTGPTDTRRPYNRSWGLAAMRERSFQGPKWRRQLRYIRAAKSRKKSGR